jgi:AcrR family transcriptional regulator
MAEPANLRERNKARARAEIAEVALGLFSERGFDAVTVDDIIASAGVSRRTFFRYFQSKEDALLADYPQLRTLLDEFMATADEGSPLTSARSTLHRVADFYLEHRPEVLARSQVMRESSGAAARNLSLLAQWEESIGGAIAAKLGRTESNLLSRASAVLIVAAFRSALGEWVRSGGTSDLHALVDEVFDLIEHGLATPFAPPRRKK